MVEIVDRDDIEAQVEAFLTTELSRARRTLLDEILRRGITPQTIAELPPDIFSLIAPNFAAGIQTQLEDVYLLGVAEFTNATTFVPTQDQLIAAQAWASQQADVLTRQMSQSTTNMLQREMTRFFASSGTTNADLMRSLAKIFTPARARRAAITEVTRSSSAAQEEIANDLRSQGVILKSIWNTLLDERVCPICGPRDRRERGDNWWTLPPAHVGCRCFVTHEVVIEDGENVEIKIYLVKRKEALLLPDEAEIKKYAS